MCRVLARLAGDSRISGKVILCLIVTDNPRSHTFCQPPPRTLQHVNNEYEDASLKNSSHRPPRSLPAVSHVPSLVAYWSLAIRNPSDNAEYSRADIREHRGPGPRNTRKIHTALVPVTSRIWRDCPASLGIVCCFERQMREPIELLSCYFRYSVSSFVVISQGAAACSIQLRLGVPSWV